MTFARATPHRPPAPEAAARSGGRSPRGMGPTPTIGPEGGVLEQEADRAADAVVRGGPPPPLTVASRSTLQRACAACAAADAERSGGQAAAAVAAGGAPLAPQVRAYFEPRFGRALDRVRVHDDAAAQRAAGAIGARAFTVGDHIGFAPGEYDPGKADGRRLLAHELAHTIQQAPFVARQPAPPFHRRRFQERAGGGTTDFEETVQAQPAPQGMSIVGSVDRREIAPGVGGGPEQEISSGRVQGIRFDPDCKIVVPFRVRFRPLATATVPFCQEPPNATAVPAPSAAQVAAISSQYIAAMNEGLNGWYAVRVAGCEGQPCVNRPIPIQIVASAVTSGEDRLVDIVNRGGRGNAGTICAGDFDASFAAHEGGHQTLGLGDEYRESDPTLRTAMPAWARDERVRTDLTRMGADSDYGRFARYNERHFRFAQVFMEAVFRGQGCTVSLAEVRAPPTDVRLSIGLSGVWGGNRPALGVTGVLGLGIPLETQRRLTLEFGLQGQMFSAPRAIDRSAYMLGARLGLEARTSPGAFGVTGDIFGSAGALYRPELSPATGPRLPERIGGYGEIGAGFGIHSPMISGVNFFLRGEGALGAEIAGDPLALRWFRAGATAGVSF